MASRGSPGILESISSDSLNRLHGFQPPPSKRRKICHTNNNNSNTPESLATTATRSISIRPHAASLSDNPIILDPVAVLPRSRFPFSWLDFSSSSSLSYSGLQHSSTSNLFASDIRALENSLQEQGGNEPAVLVTRLVSSPSSSDEGAGLYVVERVKKGIYSLSRLGSWVHEGDVFVAIKGWRDGLSSFLTESIGECESSDNHSNGMEGFNWWEVARVDEPVADSGLSATKRSKFDVSVVFAVDNDDDGSNVNVHLSPPDSARRSLARDMPPTVERCSSVFDVNTPTVLGEQSGLVAPSTTEVGSGSDSNKTDALQPAQELLDSLREQYIEALYISKTSVAYFAKGPLARCRSAFQSSDPEDSKKPADLVEFYREAVLTAKKMDTKYRETLPSTIRNVVISVSDDESATRTKKRKTRKKKKLGKNGLYPEEEEFIRKWWKDRNLTEHATLMETNREAGTKRHVADLRLRETQLQILLILEAMALESIVSNEPKGDGNDDDKIPSAAVKKSKSKKAQDLNVLLELHLDRLCIWHAVSFEETVVTDSAKAHDSSHLAGKKVESDAVRDFCTEVIIPFYASRLPEKCKLITRKFGVSGTTSSPPAKPSHSKSVSRVEPGAAVKRQQHQPQLHKSRRTLQRVLTDEQTASQKRRHPSLARSSTEPSQWDVKRESMEPLLPVLNTSVRGGIQKPKRVDNREVDLNAAAKQHETKLKKMQMLVDQKKELDAAINALRKPNRELVAKDVADAADKRLSTGGGSSRKPKNPVRNPLGHGVQVMATPKKGSRRKDVGVVGGVPPLLPKSLVRTTSSSTAKENNGFSSPFGSDAQVIIPASTFRPGASSGQMGAGAIQETPCRRPPPRPVVGGCGSRVPLAENGANNVPRHKGNLFRVPNIPAPSRLKLEETRNEENDMAPSTPVSSRRVGIRKLSTSISVPSHADVPSSSKIKETPPSKQNLNSATTITTAIPTLTFKDNENDKSMDKDTPTILATPVKNMAKPATASAAAMPETPQKSIYEQLGWDAEDDVVL